jgi:hypothetical protein
MQVFLTLMDRFGFTIFTTGYLEKRAHAASRGPLKQGEQENYFEQYSS